MAMEEEREIMEPYELHYYDLLSLSSVDAILPSSSSSSSSSPAIKEGDIEQLEAVSKAIMEALGPTGSGLLAITGVPNAAELRNTLLPLARDLALLNDDDRKRILNDHGLGSDVPLKNLDRCVSSFAMQLKYSNGQGLSNLGYGTPDGLNKHNTVEANFAADGNNSSMDNHFKDLSGSFGELGICMMDLGLRLARICDRAIGGKELEKSLLESGTAKGRLIHYHSYLDTHIIKETGRRNRSKKGLTNSKSDNKSSDKNGQMQRNCDDGRSSEKICDLWQQWHYDYGTFTVLTCPMFITQRSCLVQNEEDGYARFHGSGCPSPSGHTYLQIFHPNKNSICIVKAPPDSFIVQVGESADILSRRKLHSTLHSVSRLVQLENISRETFVVFLHPAWNMVFDISNYPTEHLITNSQYGENEERPQGGKQAVKKLTQEIRKIIPPLLSRLKDGMTFAEFSRETTKQYYGGRGLQSNQ